MTLCKGSRETAPGLQLLWLDLSVLDLNRLVDCILLVMLCCGCQSVNSAGSYYHILKVLCCTGVLQIKKPKMLFKI